MNAGLASSGLGWTVRNCGFFGNVALTYGGGVYDFSSTVLDSCTFAANSCGTALGGGGIFCNGGNVPHVFTNCIVYSNWAGTVTNEIQFVAAVTGLFQNCCISSTNKFGGFSTTFTSCFTNNPMFAILGSGYGTKLLNGPFDFRLQKDSPCKDTGLTESWMTGAKDLAGNPRISGATAIVDIGCYEYLAQPVIGTSVFFR